MKNIIDNAMEGIKDKSDQKSKKIAEKENKGKYCHTCGSKLVKGNCPKC